MEKKRDEEIRLTIASFAQKMTMQIAKTSGLWD
jgi:hypothetical protein